MPLREFGCKRCGKQFEVLILSPKDSREIRCPDCGSDQLRLLLSGFAVGKDIGCASCSAKSCQTCKGGG